MTLDPELQRLIESAREADLPDAARLSRVRERLLQQLGPVGSGATSATQAVGAKTAATGVGFAVKAAGILSVVGLAVWSAQHLPQRGAEVDQPVTVERSAASENSAPSVASPPSPKAPAPSSEVAGASAPLQPLAAGAAAEVEHRSPRQPRARTPVHRAAPQERANDFAGELSLMQRAVHAQRAGQIAEARALLAEHARRYPQGALRAERERLAAQLATGATPD